MTRMSASFSSDANVRAITFSATLQSERLFSTPLQQIAIPILVGLLAANLLASATSLLMTANAKSRADTRFDLAAGVH